MSLLHKSLLVAAVAALGLVLAGCASSGTPAAEEPAHDQAAMGDGMEHGSDAAHAGGHGAAEDMPAPVDGAPEAAVTAVDIDFEPATLDVTAGEPINVTVTNEGQAFHDFTLEAAGVHVNLEPGESKTTSLTLDEPGTYEAECTVPGHADAGMTVTVTAS